MKTSSKLTSKESFAILHKIENEKYPTDGSIKLSDWCDQMQKARLEADNRAATVTKIENSCKIEVTFNQTKCIDYYAGEYEILSELEGDAKVFTKRRNGYWVAEGQSYKDGVILMLHYQNHYIDPSF